MDADEILRLRKDRLGWTQGQLAEYLGIDRATVSRMEGGQRPSGPVERLLKQLAADVPSPSEASEPVFPPPAPESA